MVVKLNSLSRWKSLDSTKAISFKGNPDAERCLRIQFNLENVTTFYIGKDQIDCELLCTIGPGLETVEFYAQGDFYVFAEKESGMVKYQSADLEPTSFEVVDPVIFTKIANRRQRNPELELIAYRLEQNANRRMADLAHEIEARYERQLKQQQEAHAAETARANAQGSNPEAGGGGKPEKVTPAEKSGSGTSGGDGSQQQGDTGAGQTGDGQSA
ncbi:hypothetical protein [Agrobacterium pusense]|uniref:hypothetical protein n=1 Tax=Agrobacterium pusense TaxID=648995 RepID=UPI0028A8C4B9|nr:hypothetical protein [Agrobacterium pusense]